MMTEFGMEIDEELINAYSDITMSRSEFALRNFVVFEKDSEAQAYCQCVLEANVKIRNLKHAVLDIEIMKEKIKQLEEKGDKISLLKAEKKKIDLVEMEISMIGAKRELEVLQNIFHEFDRTFTREEIDFDQPYYWEARLKRQAALDYMANNRVGIGNLDALRMAGMRIPEFVEVPAVKSLGFIQQDSIQDVEKRYLEKGNEKILIAIPTIEKLTEKDQELLDKLMPDLPTGKQIKFFNVPGQTIPQAYTTIVMQALKDNADYILTIEHDTFAPKDALNKLLKIMNEENLDVVGVWYPRRNTSIRESTAIIIGKDGKRCSVPADGQLHEVYTVPFGFTLFRTKVFTQISQPWFAETPNLTQDSFFSQKARESGIKLYIDSSIKAKHIDPETGVIFE